MRFVSIIHIACCFIWSSRANAEMCTSRANDVSTVRCIADDGISDVSYKDCHKAKHCCQTKQACYAKPLKSPPKLQDEPNDQEMIDDMMNIIRKSSAGTARFLPIGPFPSLLALPYGGEDPYPGFSPLPPFVCQKRPSVSITCGRVDPKKARFVKNPPTDIPYCVRIPCDPKRLDLDLKPSDCRATPGCYFDKELSEHRGHFGHSMMPGVPVCHLAIRNAVFQDEAHKIVNKTGSWSAYLTECLLDTFDQVIRAPKDGCRYLSMLKYFQHKPKLAGWKSIDDYDCVLIDACWYEKQCYYPVDITSLTVRPLTTQEKNAGALYYGRPKCQEFDDKNAKSAISSYHNCLISGCVLDRYAQKSYYNYLFGYGKTMKASDHWVFWRGVESGKYGAHNFEEFNPMPEHDTTITPFSLVIPYPPSTGEENLLNELLNPASSIIDMLKSGSGLQVPPSHSDPSDGFFEELQGIQTPCSSSFTTFGARPCGPPDYNPTDVPDHCPYKPVNVKGLKALKGSFEGCCDINLCYLPKEEIPGASSGAAVYLSVWSYWTECSTTCGVGTKNRWRKCIGIDQSLCKEKLRDEAACEIQPCSSWQSWGPWTACPTTCGGGIRTRSRQCAPPDGFCPGNREEVRECGQGFCNRNRNGAKEAHGPWSEWKGTCDPCGKSIYRERNCNAVSCDDADLFETKRCSSQCGSWTSWTPFGDCLYDFFTDDCQKSRTRACVDENGWPATCIGSEYQYRSCNGC